jgi:adhesin HecA-like repeat protein
MLSLSAQASQISVPMASSAASSNSHGSGIANHQNALVSRNINLSASRVSASAPNSAPVSIVIGGSSTHGTINGGSALTINPGQLITPAEYAAVMQVMHGSQSLLLNSMGAAIGGSLILNSKNVQNLSSLVVPKNVTLEAIGYTASKPLKVTSTVSDSGSIYAVQGSANVSSVLDLGGLNIGATGLLSGSLPSVLNTNGRFASSGLILNLISATRGGNLVNSGQISSPGDLKINSTGTIANSGLGTISAGNTLTLTVGTGGLINSGLIHAGKNIQLDTINNSTNLNINAVGGTFQALNGSINVRETGYSGSANILAGGGNWLSQNLNFNGGTGSVTVMLGQVTGNG